MIKIKKKGTIKGKKKTLDTKIRPGVSRLKISDYLKQKKNCLLRE